MRRGTISNEEHLKYIYYQKVNKLMFKMETGSLKNYDENEHKYFKFDNIKCQHCFEYCFKCLYKWLEFKYRNEHNILDYSKLNNLDNKYDQESLNFICETEAYISLLCCLKSYSRYGFSNCEKDDGQNITEAEFKYSIDHFYNNLLNKKILKKFGSFEGSNKLLLRTIFDNNGKMYSNENEEIYKTIPGEWNIYKTSNYKTHWRSTNEKFNTDDWESTVFAINSNLGDKSLDSLCWIGVVVYAYCIIHIASPTKFCDKDTLSKIIKNKKEYKKSYSDIIFDYVGMNGHVSFMLSDGCVLSAPENRQRMAFCGKDENNNILAIYIPSCG